jgi:hypothetical protein
MLNKFTFTKNDFLILFFLCIVALIYGVPKLFKERSVQIQLNDRLKEEEALKQTLKKYYEIVPANQPPVDWKDVRGGQSGISASLENTRLTIECPNKIKLRDDDIISYVTEAPEGELIFIEGQWYVSKISKTKATKTDVIDYLNTCIPALDKKFREVKRIEQNNQSSWN